MVVQINKGVVSMVFIAFQRILRGGELGKQRYDELIGMLQSMVACVEHILSKVNA